MSEYRPVENMTMTPYNPSSTERFLHWHQPSHKAIYEELLLRRGIEKRRRDWKSELPLKTEQARDEFWWAKGLYK